MQFNEYAKQQDVQTYLENAGINAPDIAIAVTAMRMWSEATEQLIAALDKIPEAHGHVGGSAMSDESGAGNTIADAIALELQRSKYVVQESGLADLASKMIQFSSRVDTAASQLAESDPKTSQKSMFGLLQ